MPYISKCSQSNALTKLYKLMMTSCYHRSWENIYFFNEYSNTDGERGGIWYREINWQATLKSE